MRRRLLAVVLVLGTALGGVVQRHGAIAQSYGGVIRCESDPPRQAPDPMSPPCVSVFNGDNGGDTAPGATADTIRVLVYIDRGGEARAATAVAQALADFHNHHYMTYHRHVSITVHEASADPVFDARWHASWHRPFAAIVDVGGVAGAAYAAEMSRLEVATFSTRGLQPGGSADAWSFWPDEAASAANVAGHVCRSLAGRRARYSGNAADVVRTRTFGVLASTDREEYGSAVGRELRDRCGIPGLVLFMPNNAQSALTAADFMRDHGVTTVVHVAGEETLFSHASALQLWFPEIVIGGDLAAETAANGRLQNQAVWRNAWAVTPDIALSTPQASYGYRAWVEAQPSGAGSNIAIAHRMYRGFFHLFYGVQAAGPTLTQDRLETGLRAVPSSTGYDERAGFWFQPGEWSGVKDAVQMWWDPTGQAPGAFLPGCMRMTRGEVRYRPDTWPSSDDGLFRVGAPCQADVRPA